MDKKISGFILTMFLLTGCATNGSLPSVTTGTTESEAPATSTSTTETISKELQDWLDSKDASDLNEDGKTDGKDYSLYKEYKAWKKNTDTAKDYNGDARINFEDYKLYLELLEYMESDDAVDYTGDSKIDEEDYSIHKAYTAWLDGDEAMDYNGDRKINYDDYKISLSPEKNIFIWLKGPDAKDYNKDNEIDKFDYYCFNFFGNYKFRNYTYRGPDMHLTGTTIDFRDIQMLANELTLTYNADGLDISFTAKGEEMLNGLTDDTKTTLKSGTLDVTSENAFNYFFNIEIFEVKTAIKAYFNYDKENNEYDTSVEFKAGEDQVNISFSLYECA